MVKRLLLSLLLALVGVAAMWAEDYPIVIGGVQLTSDNYQNITAAGGFAAVKSGAGTVTYDPATLTLTLSNAVIEATGTGVNGIYFTGGNNDYTLVLAEGTSNTVTNDADNASALFEKGALTIEGGGACTFTGLHYWAIYKFMGSNKILTIRNCSVTARGKCGIRAYSNSNGNLVIDNATVRASGTTDGPIRYFNAVTLTDVEIVSPSGAEWNETAHAICMAGSDTPITTEVLIEPYVSEPETVVGERVLNASRYDVNKDGEVTPADLTLLVNALVGRANYLATGLTLSKSQARLLPGSTTQLTATVTPETADYNVVAWTTSDKSVATVTTTGLVTARHAGTCTITAQTLDGSNLTASCEVTIVDPSSINTGGDYVDLGLPSGTLWATCNLGASSPEGFGDFYAWGMTTPVTPKEAYTYTYEGDVHYDLELQNDAAYMTLGSGWRMPSKEQFEELIAPAYTTQTYTTQNGVKGLLIMSIVPGYESYSIFLPAASYQTSYGNTSYGTDEGYYWSRTGSNVAGGIYNNPALLNFENTEGVKLYSSMSEQAATPIRPVRNQ